MQALSILAITRFETFLSGFPHLLGMLIVMITLAILWGVCAFTAHLVKTFSPAPTPEPVCATLAVAAPSTSDQEISSAIPAEIVAVIAAAVHSVIGKGHQIVAIKQQDSNWGQAGRQSVLSSHKIR